MNNNVIQTKKKLTIIFTMIVFFVILLLWTSFFTFKYISDISLEKKWFESVINNLESWKISINNFLELSKWFQEPHTVEWKKILDRHILKNNLNPRGFMNHILINDSQVISSDIKDIVDENFLLKILKNNNKKIYQESSFLIKKFESNDNVLILFKKVKYSIIDYGYDLLLFIFINICFSAIFYFIWYKFVNKAFVPVEENIKDMNDFVQNAGHEFKTPLSVIDSNIQLMQEIKEYNPEMLDEIKQEGLKVNALIDSLIKLTNIEAIHVTQDVNLEWLIQEILANFKYQITDKNITTQISIDKNISIKSDKNYLYITLSNIIWNAIKYNIKNGSIDISYKNDTLIIKDSWIWIENSEIEKIFNRFYKVDISRNSEWFGIWLSLVMKIINIYNWNISVESEKDKWTSFYLKF